MLIQVSQGPPASVLALTVLLLILEVVAIVMMSRPAGAGYFGARPV
jgi:hypothetical protein